MRAMSFLVALLVVAALGCSDGGEGGEGDGSPAPIDPDASVP